MLISTGDGKSRDMDFRTTIYKREPDQVYQLKMKASRGEVDSFKTKVLKFKISNFLRGGEEVRHNVFQLACSCRWEESQDGHQRVCQPRTHYTLPRSGESIFLLQCWSEWRDGFDGGGFFDFFCHNRFFYHIQLGFELAFFMLIVRSLCGVLLGDISY